MQPSTCDVSISGDATWYLWPEHSPQPICPEAQQPLIPRWNIADVEQRGGYVISVSWDMLCFYMRCFSGDLRGVRQTVSVSRAVLFQHVRIGQVAFRASDFARLGHRAGQPTSDVLEYLVAEENGLLRRMAWRLAELVPMY